ncbi:MAG: electron transfer flavoprotein subunit beta/FixA family protein [Bacteroides sp.]|nr:electron transfer flavoprotein subunit beta/FixA family protein [Ruminococcus flavefaciens]MCM1555713.1 electron transfer flavoprotein subunit beta/FixA family protein [Bacteroides sp.]
MSFRIVVLAKQVPDTRNVGKDAMKEDGTINRAALPAIYNPEDLNALEMAIQMKEKIAGAEIIVLTMGPGRAAEIVRESMYRGADGGFVISDMKFAGADTLATSYTLSMALRKLAPFNVVLCGRQAIDGDTAQVGPQTAEKLALPQITYAESLVNIDDKSVTIRRRLERGVETVKAPLPCLVTVGSSAKECRPRHAVRVMTYKYAATPTEMASAEEKRKAKVSADKRLQIGEWTANDLAADPERLGLAGSPTKVKKIDNVVLVHKEAKVMDTSDKSINELMQELLASHIIG